MPVYHPDVTRLGGEGRGGKHVGLWYFDPYARDRQALGRLDERVPHAGDASTARSRPIVSNNANFVKGAPGEPVLISWDDAITLFHEFGHALHGLNSDVTYPSLVGHQRGRATSWSSPRSSTSTGCRRRRC